MRGAYKWGLLGLGFVIGIYEWEVRNIRNQIKTVEIPGGGTHLEDAPVILGDGDTHGTQRTGTGRRSTNRR